MRLHLTQKTIERGLVCPDGRKQIEFCDTDLPGLYVSVSKVSPGIGTYYLRYKNDAGKTCHKKIGRTTDISLKDARDRAKILKLEVSQGKDVQALTKQRRQTMSYNAFMLEHFFPYITPRRRNAKGYRQMYDLKIKPVFGDIKVNQITKQQVQSFHNDLREQGLANATANRYLQLIKSSINYGIKMEILDLKRNPAVGIELFEEQGRERYLSKDELSRLMPVLINDGGQVAKITRFLLATGLRRGECLNCKWENIDIDNRVMVIPSHSAKSKKVDSIPLNNAAVQVLQECDRSNIYPFANPATGKPYVSINKGFQKLMKKAEIQGVTAHTLRHSHASFLLANGTSLSCIQRILRHSNISVTQKYAHLSPASVQSASDTLSDQLMQAATGNQ